MKKERDEIIYTATYTQKSKEAVGGKVTFRFVGKGMQQEFKTFEDIIEQLYLFKKEMMEKGKDIEIKVYRHSVQEINPGF